MKKLALFGLAVIFSFPLTTSNAFDSTPPSLGTVTVSQTSLPETGGTVVVTAQITATAYGLDQAPLFVFQQDGYSKNFSCTRPIGLRMTLVAGDEKSGSYRCETDFAAPLKPGVYKLMFFPLTDKGGNSTGGFINTNFSVAIGVPAVAAKPTPKPTISSKPEVTSTQGSADAGELLSLKTQVAALQSQLKTLQAKLNKICSGKPKPKGC
jgi:hypothetical protein